VQKRAKANSVKGVKVTKMADVRIEISPSITGNQSILTPLIKKALLLYKYSYGLIPPLLVDLDLRENDVQIKFQKKDCLNIVWFLFVFVVGILIQFGMVMVLAKSFFLPAKATVETIELLSLVQIFFGLVLLYALSIIVWLHYDKLVFLNQLFANELEFRKKKFSP